MKSYANIMSFFDSNTKSIVAYMLAHTTTLVACIFSRRLLVAVVPVGSVDGTTAIHGTHLQAHHQA
jgi:hypothetical protein